MHESNEPLPMVTVLSPIRNESDFIERCIRSVLENDYPSEKMEILVVDGMSDDGTREIVSRIAEEDSRVKLLDNPQRIVPTAMNIGIRASQGEIIIRVDGHTEVDRDFISENIRIMHEHPDVWVSGGVMETVGSTTCAKAIAQAMQSPVGVGAGNFRLGAVAGYVEAVPFGAHRRWVFDKVGLFDEELVRNQDDEHIQRMKQAGAKTFMSPTIRSRYFARTSLRKLARQYFQYGFWRIRTIQKHRRAMNLRQWAPLTFVLLWISLIVGSIIWWPLVFILAAFAACYLFALLSSVWDARKRGLKIAFLVPVAILIMHFCYGFGSLTGLWSWVLLRGRFVRRGASHPMSR